MENFLESRQHDMKLGLMLPNLGHAVVLISLSREMPMEQVRTVRTPLG